MLNDVKRQCFYDYLDVFFVDIHGRLFWQSRHCGAKITAKIVSNSPTLILVFKSDRMLSYRGFKFRYHFSYINILPFVTDPLCGPSEIVGNGSSLQSSNYPNNYASFIECAWTITVEKHQNIMIKFVDVNLIQPCQHSYINIWDGYVNDVNTPDLKVCEKLIYYHKGFLSFKSKSNRVVIRFVGNRNLLDDMRRNQTKIIKSTSTTVSNNHIEGKKSSRFNDFLNETLSITKRTQAIKYGFSLTWTAIHLANDCGDDFKCMGGEYCIDSKKLLCQPTYQYCISQKLVCDGMYNCDLGDKSDESHCNLSFLKISKVYLLALVSGGVTFIFISLMMTFLVYKCKTNKLNPLHKEIKENISEKKIMNNNNNNHSLFEKYHVLSNGNSNSNRKSVRSCSSLDVCDDKYVNNLNDDEVLNIQHIDPPVLPNLSKTDGAYQHHPHLFIDMYMTPELARNINESNLNFIQTYVNCIESTPVNTPRRSNSYAKAIVKV